LELFRASLQPRGDKGPNGSLLLEAMHYFYVHHGATMSSPKGSGNRPNTKKFICVPYDSVTEARASIGRYLIFYNTRRPHSSLDCKTPDQAYFNQPTPIQAAA
jgi:hypothetical protein